MAEGAWWSGRRSRLFSVWYWRLKADRDTEVDWSLWKCSMCWFVFLLPVKSNLPELDPRGLRGLHQVISTERWMIVKGFVDRRSQLRSASGDSWESVLWWTFSCHTSVCFTVTIVSSQKLRQHCRVFHHVDVSEKLYITSSSFKSATHEILFWFTGFI